MWGCLVSVQYSRGLKYVTFSQVGGVTTLRCSRSLVDSDYPINPNNETYLNWAYGASNTFREHANKRVRVSRPLFMG